MTKILSLRIHRLKKSHEKNKKEIAEIIRELNQIKKTLTKYKEYLIMRTYFNTTCELIDKFKLMYAVEQANYEKKLAEEERNLEL